MTLCVIGGGVPFGYDQRRCHEYQHQTRDEQRRKRACLFSPLVSRHDQFSIFTGTLCPAGTAVLSSSDGFWSLVPLIQALMHQLYQDEMQYRCTLLRAMQILSMNLG